MKLLKKSVAIMILIVFLVSINISTVKAVNEIATENTAMEEKDVDIEQNDTTTTNTTVEDSEKTSEDTDKPDDEMLNGEELQSQEVQKITDEDEQEISTVANIDFSASVQNSGEYEIKTFPKNGLYYLFLSKDIDISNLKIKYNYTTDIKEVTPTDGIVSTAENVDTVHTHTRGFVRG